ncbi:unnamed protein product [Schistosoma margrebowiei]|uniref:non-specific serine/threonine protein kinase n=1 Tax=Schistosoma margrebowiei TaxID=48269 RepID=A0A183LCD6_9TREM|nr:unnamed protein product [Schistosoma margrebowiei]
MEVDTGSIAKCAPELYDIASTLVNVEEVTDNKAFNDFKLSKPIIDMVSPVTEAVVSDPDPKSPQNRDNTTAEPSVAPVVVNNNVGKYRLLRTIGKGNFAKVKLAIHMATGVEVAIKIINKTVMDNTLLKRLKREITIMKVTNHPNIVKLLEIIENEDVLCLVMEYASGGEIFDYLVANGKMCEKKARVKFRQLLSAMQYCHAKRIVHRDLKAENILLDQNLNVKVADFGLANTFESDQRLTTFCGSPPYAAPELFLGIPYYGPSVDIWSLGVILFTLVLGHLPFDARDLRELRSKILGLHYTIPRGAVSPECDTLLRKMLVLDPKDRSSLKSLMLDKWVNMGYAPDDHLRPYRELPKSQLDDSRVKAMEEMGFTRADLESSVVNPAFDHVYATYHLLPETPSQFVELCKDLAPGAVVSPNTIVLPNSLLTHNQETKSTHSCSSESSELPVSTKPTAIGRFTVAPSNKVNEPTSHSSSGRCARGSLTSESNQASAHHKNVHNFEYGNREHHSLTSALPNTLKRAIMQVSRNFTGGGTPTTNNEESSNRGTAQIVTGHHNKSVPKSSGGGRDVITAAPVPIGAVKKHGFGLSQQQQTQKRQPLNPQSASHPQNPPVRSKSPAIRNHSSSSNTSSASSESHGTQKMNKESSVAMKASSDMNYRGSINNTCRDNDKSSLQGTQKRNMVDANGAKVSGSSTSSNSGAESELRERATTIVQGVCKSVNASSLHHQHYTPQSVLEAKQEFKENDDRSCLVPGNNNELIHFEQTNLRNEKSELSRSLTTIDQTNQMTNNSDKTANVPSLNPQIKVLHTVQGTEALALRLEALRLQSVNSTTKPSSNLEAAANIRSTDGRSDNQSSTRLLNKPREVKFPWSVYTTSTKSAEELLQSIIHALEVTPGCRYSHDPHLPFLLQCSWAADRPAIKKSDSEAACKDQANTSFSGSLEVPSHGGLLRGDPVHWEMEVCQLPRVHLRGVRLKRIRGSTLHFRPIADLVMKSLRL